MEIHQVLVTARFCEANRKKLIQALEPARIIFAEDPDYNEILRIYKETGSKDAAGKVLERQTAELSRIMRDEHVDVAILNSDLSNVILEGRELKWIHCCHAGVENSTRKEIFERNIILTSSSGRSAPALAEHAFMFLLYFTYDLPCIERKMAEHRWGLGREYAEHTGMYGKTIAVLGLGHTGLEVAKRAKVFGMNVVGYRRENKPCEFADSIYAADAHATIEDAVKDADYVVLCLSLNDSTYHCIGEKQLKSMRSDAVLVNMGHGGLIDEEALADALINHEIAGAGLDTVEQEPLAADSPMWELPNVLITPHVTPPLKDREERSLQYVLDNIALYRAGKELENRVYEWDAYTRRQEG